MSTINWTLADLANLEKAIASGVKSVEYNDREVIYRSLKEMLQARQLIRKALGLVRDTSRRFCSTSKGTS